MYRESHMRAIAILTFSIRSTARIASGVRGRRREITNSPPGRIERPACRVSREQDEPFPPSATPRRAAARGDEIVLVSRTAAVARRRLERQRHRLRAEAARAAALPVIHQVEEGTAYGRDRARRKRPV